MARLLIEQVADRLHTKPDRASWHIGQRNFFYVADGDVPTCPGGTSLVTGLLSSHGNRSIPPGLLIENHAIHLSTDLSDGCTDRIRDASVIRDDHSARTS